MTTPTNSDTATIQDVHAYAQQFESFVGLTRGFDAARAEERTLETGIVSAASRRAAAVHGIQYAAKRFIDYVGAGCGLVLISPLLLAVAVLIKLDSRGPVLFRQVRVGKDGRQFVFYKFRTMEHGCDPALHRERVTKLIHGELGDDARGSDGSFKLERDPRITRVGRVMRRTSVDELPQLLNVLKGEMSLVGPRPQLPYEVELYTDRHLRRLKVLPGVTGLWQVSGRTRLTHEQMIDLDLEYVDNWSLALDGRILLKTIRAVVGEDGAG